MLVIELTKERAIYFRDELDKLGIDAEITESTDNWATIEIEDDDIETAESIIVFAFNCGVTYGRNNPTN